MKVLFLSLFVFVPTTLYSCATIKDSTPYLVDYFPYKEVEADTNLSGEFSKYIRLLASLEVPDAQFVVSLIDQNDKTIEALSLIHHEKVELREWLRLGHRLQDIMNVEYYREHYKEVYPVAHSLAIVAEMELLKHYASKRGFSYVPELAFGLVTPLVEQRQESVENVARRFRYNPEYTKQKNDLRREDLEVATQVFEDGGYCYENLKDLLEQAIHFISH
jgi:hypothetical protein